VIDYIGRTVLLVRNYDEAIRFYREKLRFEVIFDTCWPAAFARCMSGLPGSPESGCGCPRRTARTGWQGWVTRVAEDRSW
jgi:catechol 2,3-dioxygenase-like lactoylglutathione lyase family enzyme